MMEGGRGRGKGREFGVRAGGEERPVARIKDPLVGLLVGWAKSPAVWDQR